MQQVSYFIYSRTIFSVLFSIHMYVQSLFLHVYGLSNLFPFIFEYSLYNFNTLKITNLNN